MTEDPKKKIQEIVKRCRGGESVSRETFSNLEKYAVLLKKWNSKVNLVAKQEVDNLWGRHVLDSVQLVDYIENYPTLDVGSGAGFPGLMVSLCSGNEVVLVEAITKKCAFLKEAVRVTGAPAIVVNKRLEEVERRVYPSITARAVTSLEGLLEMVFPFMGSETKCYFLKGRGVDKEIEEAQKKWCFKVKKVPSLGGENEGVLLIISGVSRASG